MIAPGDDAGNMGLRGMFGRTTSCALVRAEGVQTKVRVMRAAVPERGRSGG
jgi:hypothetical protein